MLLYKSLSLGAQTAYAELQDQLQSQQIGDIGVLPGSFQRLIKRGKPYIYYNFRDADGTPRMAYIGPENERVLQLLERAKSSNGAPAQKIMTGQAKAALAMGCMPTLAKHFRVIARLGQYGFFRAGGILVGTHAFIAIGNMLGVKWSTSHTT